MGPRFAGRPARDGRVRARSNALVGTALAALLTLASLGAALPAAAAASATGARSVVAEPAATPAPTVVVTEVLPRAIGTSDTVRVTALVTNTTDVPLESAHAQLGVVRYRLSSREALRGWAAGEVTTIPPTPVARQDLEGPLAPGASRVVTLTAPAVDLRLLPYPESSGVRGIVVSLADPVRGTLGEGRGFLTWTPTLDVDPVRLSVIVPLTGPAPDPTDVAAWSTRIGVDTAPGGRLSTVVAGTAATKGVSWVVDPALVEQAAAGTPVTAAWASALLAGANGRDVFATDRFDPDLAALAAADVTPLGDDREPLAPPSAAATQPDDQATPTDNPVEAARRAAQAWRTDLALPATRTASTTLLAAAASAGRSLIVVDDGLAGTGMTTAPGSVAVTTDGGSITALVPDAILNQLFAEATAPLDPAVPAAHAAAARSHALMVLLAELATVGEEPALAQPHVVITADRSWSPDGAAVTAVLATLAGDRTIDLVPVSTLVGSPQAAVPRTPLPESASPVADLRPVAVRRAWERVSDVRAFSDVAADPGALSDGPVDATSAALAVAWRSATGERLRLLGAARAQTERILEGISVVAGSDINLISDRGDLPIRIRNDLGVAVSIGVALVPDDPRLSVLDTPSAVVEPGTEVNVEVPVRAIGSGDVTVLVQLRGPSGDVVAEPYAFDVRVRAEWETVGTAVIGVLLALLVLGGVVRTIRRGRSTRRTAPIRPLEDA
ncbi:DUF6049 family protein [Sanguibacter sp. A247]|uniref:DUF6049 family protein n=1 Tax=unclassified Sanguibacter TaxID=2645534 RepID=UPI003FD7C3A1